MNEQFQNQNIKILLVHNDKNTAQILSNLLRQEKYQVFDANNYNSAVKLVEDEKIDLVVIDLFSAEDTGLEIIKRIKRSFPNCGTVVIAEFTDDPRVIQCVTEGAQDSILKPLVKESVSLKIQSVLEKITLKRELANLRQQVAMNYGFDNIVGISKSLIQIKETARRITATDITVMLTGTPGTGKELLARTIHHHSHRRRKPFIVIDCSTTPEEHLAIELFGQVENTSSMDTKGKPGLFEKAEGGTIFLDEVSDLPTSIQNRLLKFFQYSEICPVGSSASRKVDVRIMAACTRDLTEKVTAGEFLADLYYRLHVIPIKLPPLTERAEDIEILTEYFLRRIAFETGRTTLTITRSALERLLTHSWPGNIRELENTLKRGAAFCRENQIETGDIMFITGEKNVPGEEIRVTRTTLTLKGGTLDKSQRTLIIKALSDNNWNYTKTASELGIGRTTLWRKIKKYNLQKEAVEG